MLDLKIVSYNIHGGLQTASLVKNIRAFAAQGVNVFCLQEFFKWTQPQDLELLLKQTLGPEWQMEYETPPRSRYDFGACTLWNKSVLEAVSFERLSLPLIPKPKVWEKTWIRVHGAGPNA